MSQENANPARPDYRGWLRIPMILIAMLIAARFFLELAQVPNDITRFISASVASGLILIYLGAVAPLRGITKVNQRVLPAIVWSAWLTGWDTLALIISAVFRLPGSHFATTPPPIFQNWEHVGLHILSHLVLILPSTVFILGLMSLLSFLHRWPVIVAPSAVLGGLVMLRFAAETMNLAQTTASAWSSTVGVLLSALYVGGMGPRMGLLSARQFLVPCLVLGWMWRFWIFMAALLSATPLFKTHFFDPSKGQVGLRLIESFGGGFLVFGAIAGVLIWGIAVWTSRALRPAPAA